MIVQPPNASAEIRAARLEQNRAMTAGEVDRAASFWTGDVSIRRGLGQTIVGRDAYRALLAPGSATDSTLVYERIPTAIDVSPQWPLAFETGTWRGRLGPQGATVIEGRYSAQWVRRDGVWLIRSEVFVALTCAGAGCRYTAVP
jgi:ketosteroid isomerase-like protein